MKILWLKIRLLTLSKLGPLLASVLLATACSMRFSDTLLAVDPECLKHENILPVLLYNIQAALNLTVYIWESKRPEQNVYYFRSATYPVLWSIFCLLFFRLKKSYVPVINFPGEELNKL